MSIKIQCEETVWYTLPIIRKELARSLIKDCGLTQRKAAEKLGITESAVSQYLSKKRGKSKSMDITIRKEIKESAKLIIAGDEQVMKKEICRICHLLMAKKLRDENLKKY